MIINTYHINRINISLRLHCRCIKLHYRFVTVFWRPITKKCNFTKHFSNVYTAIDLQRWNISSRNSSKCEADTLELLEKCKEYNYILCITFTVLYSSDLEPIQECVVYIYKTGIWSVFILKEWKYVYDMKRPFGHVLLFCKMY